MKRKNNANSHILFPQSRHAVLILFALIVGVILIEIVVDKWVEPSLSADTNPDTLPEFSITTLEEIGSYADAVNHFSSNANGLTHAFAAYEQDLLDHFDAAWIVPYEIDSSITQEIFGVLPYQLETLTNASQLLWNRQTEKGVMSLLGWMTQSASTLDSSLASHSAYLKEQGWIPVASNSEHALSFVKDQGGQEEKASKEYRYSWLLVELLTVGDRTFAIYSFQ